MSTDANPSVEPLAIIKRCVRDQCVFWTYHVNMRMMDRAIERNMVIDSVDTYEIIESYPQDRFLPTYLVWASDQGDVIHIVFAVDIEDDNVRVVTVYRPNPTQWDERRKRRQA